MKSIVIVGKISSGKTSICDKMHNKIPDSIKASFGAYLRWYCLQNGIEFKGNRKILQDLGQKFIKENPINFLKNVIDHTTRDYNNFSWLLFDGVRHKVILDSIIQLSSITKALYIDASEEIRYERYLNRYDNIDANIFSFQDFINRSNHPVELEIEGLKPYCDIVINTDKNKINTENLLKILGITYVSR